MDLKSIDILGIDANNYYYLYWIHGGKVGNWPRWSVNPANLHALGYLENNNLTKKGMELFTGPEINEEYVKEYNEIFPKVKLPSGLQGRAHPRDVKNALEKFHKKYNYSKEIVLEAAKKYVEEYTHKQFMFMKNSYYFIDKRGEPSVLASYCESGLNPEKQIVEKQHFLGGNLI